MARPSSQQCMTPETPLGIDPPTAVFQEASESCHPPWGLAEDPSGVSGRCPGFFSLSIHPPDCGSHGTPELQSASSPEQGCQVELGPSHSLGNAPREMQGECRVILCVLFLRDCSPMLFDIQCLQRVAFFKNRRPRICFIDFF